MERLEEGMLSDGLGESDALGRLVLQHLLDQVEQLTMLLGVRADVSLHSR